MTTIRNSDVIYTVGTLPDDGVIVKGQVLALGDSPMRIEYKAPAPLTKRHSKYGSAMAHPNVDQAYDVRANSGVIQSNNGSFVISLPKMPGAYYSGLGSQYVPPHIEMVASLLSGKQWRGSIWLSDGNLKTGWIAGKPPGYEAPNDQNDRAMYYLWNPDSGVRTQEEILRKRAV